VEEHGEDFFRNPVGTGPFVLTEWVRGMRIRFSPNPHYFIDGEPRLDGVSVMIGGDTLVHQMMFERGELDLKEGIPIPDFVRITTDPKWQPYTATAADSRTVYLSMNCEMEPFTDKRVRQAMNYAIDRGRIVKMLTGRCVAARGVLPPPMPGHDPDMPGYAHDPGKAKQLLAEAGLADGFSLPMWFRSDTGYERKAAEVIQQDLAEVGVEVDLRPVAFATLCDIMAKRRGAELGIFGWSQDYPDPSNFLDVLLNGERIVEVNCNNAAFYSNPDVNDLLRVAAKETDAAARLRIYQQVERMIVDDAPWVFLYHPVRHALRQPWLRGHSMHPVWPQRLEKLWFDTEDPQWEARP
ncbi:MAG TPA: ABC transporter substrate-binding protein, partial [Armatimonadota bacterium]|nr:ABC transporter substrate-binding protein [Armatimonadota bacterium]